MKRILQANEGQPPSLLQFLTDLCSPFIIGESSGGASLSERVCDVSPSVALSIMKNKITCRFSYFLNSR